MSIELSLATAKTLPFQREPARKVHRTAPAANDELIHQTLPISRLKSESGHDRDFSPSMLAFVLGLHILTISTLVYQSTRQPVEMPQAEPAAMLVSLVSEPAIDPVHEIEEAPPEPVPVKPVVKRPKSVEQTLEPKLKIEPRTLPAEIPVQTPIEPIQETESIATADPVALEATNEPKPQTEPSLPTNSTVGKVVDPQPVVEPPRFGAAYLHNPPPKYPPASRRLGEEGRVMLRVLVSADGASASVEVESSSGFDRLDKAAIDAVRKWQFIPAKRDKKPIDAHVIVPIQFTLSN